MAITLGDVILYLGADDSRLNGVLKGVEGKTQGWVNGLGGKLALGLGGIVTAAVGGAAALGLAAFKSGETIDAAFDTLITKTGASGDALNQLQEDFKAVFTTVPTQAQPLADVLSLLHERTTLVGKDNQELAKQLLESARIMGGDAKTNTELYTRLMGDWSISNEDAAETLDKVFLASQQTGIGMDRLMGLAVQFGSPMRLMGFSIEDTLALLSKWEKEGVNTELVMGSLRIAAGKFADEGKPLRESLMATFESIKNNTDATAALAEGMDVFGARAGPDMVAAIREGRFNIDDLVKSLENGEGAIDKTAKATMDWGEKLTILKNKATLALAPIGLKLMDIAGVLVDRAGPALDKFAGILDTYVAPAIDKAVDAFGYLMDRLDQGDSLFTMFEDGSSILGGFFERLGMGEDAAEALAQKIITVKNVTSEWINGTLIPFVQQHGPEIQAALIAIGAALAAAGVVSIVTGIVAAIAGLLTPVGLLIGLAALLGVAWANNWGGIQQKTAFAIEFIKFLIAGGMQFINDMVNGRLGLLSQIFSATWENIQLLFAAFQAAFNGDWHLFGELLRQATDNAWAVIKAIFTTAWSNILSGVSTAVQTMKNTDWSSVGRSILEGIAHGITAGLGIIRDAAINAAQAALEAAQGFLLAKSPSERAAREIGVPIAEGVGVGVMRGFKGMGPVIGQGGLDAVKPFSGLSAGSGSGVINFTYVDQRFISLSDELDAERILRPILQRMLRGKATA